MYLSLKTNDYILSTMSFNKEMHEEQKNKNNH